jgi:DNA-binding LytR/AlgR family response regulator
MEGYELDVVDYLLKPIPFDRFFKAVKKASLHLNNNGRNVPALAEEASFHMPQATPVAAPVSEKNYFFIKADGKLIKVNYVDIKFIEGMKDYLKIHTTTNAIVTHHTMKAMEEQLPSNKFMRVHKSYIIALNAIKSIEGNIIHLDMDKAEVPLGSSFKDALLAAVAL